MKRAFVVCAVAILVALAGCGSGGAGTGAADPAAMAPPGTLAYASFELAPQGPQKVGFDAAFTKLLGPDPEAKLGAAFTKAVRSNGTLDYQADVKPWLGQSVSLVVTRVGLRSADYALLAASTNDDKASAAIDKDLAGSNAEARSYGGVSYKLLKDGTANGVVSHFVVAGTEAAFKAIVDAAQDGKSLADSDQWQQTVGKRADGKVALAYLDTKGLLQSVAANLPGAERVAAPFLLGLLDLHPFVATLDAKPDSLIADVSSPGTKPDPRGPGAAASPLIDSLPAGSWFAAAIPQVGQALGRITGALRANPMIAARYAQAVGQFRARAGLDLNKDVLAALGDVGVFVRGATPQTVRGGLVVRSRKPATLARTMRRVPALIESGTRGRVTVVPRRGGFDLKARRMAQPFQVRRVLGASANLGNTVLFKKAASVIGQRPTLLIDVAPALSLAAASPHHRSDRDFQDALPRLRHIEFVAAGARRDDGIDVVRAVVGLR